MALPKDELLPETPFAEVEIDESRPSADYSAAQIRKNGGLYRQAYRQGDPTTPVERIDDTDLPIGTTVTFKPDDTLFTTTDFSFETHSQRFREMACLTKGPRITLFDERPGPGE